jgi:type IV pilus assembly protein PilE
LIEVMITVAIIAILAAVAFPNYQDYVRRSRRSEAQAFMSEVVARQQHFLLDRRAYAVSITAAPTSNGLGMTIPTSVSSFYTVEFNPPVNNGTSPPSFSLIATPIGAQAAEKCGWLRITNTGVKTVEKGTCW